MTPEEKLAYIYNYLFGLDGYKEATAQSYADDLSLNMDKLIVEIARGRPCKMGPSPLD